MRPSITFPVCQWVGEGRGGAAETEMASGNASGSHVAIAKHFDSCACRLCNKAHTLVHCAENKRFSAWGFKSGLGIYIYVLF